MSRADYEFAELSPEAIEEIQKTEQSLSERYGQPITLIAYTSGTTPVEKELL
jgi:long-subunit acyl-CoA synthetase (AMP-forming)